MSEDAVDRIVEKFQKYCAEKRITLTDENYDEVLRKAVTPAEYALCTMPDGLHDEIKGLCAKGDACAERGDYEAALKLYWKAWDALPDPKTDYEAATWILAVIGDANFLSGDFEAGRDNLSNAMHCPDGIGNPFLHLRLGQCQFELGNLDRAADELTRAMMGAGEEILQDDDPKYWEFLKTKLRPPPGGWSQDAQKKRPWWKIW
jgi:tetratricopeptide (TPR) repeat protein